MIEITPNHLERQETIMKMFFKLGQIESALEYFYCLKEFKEYLPQN